MRLVKKLISCILITGLVVNMQGVYVYINAGEIGYSRGIHTGNTNASNLRDNSDKDSILVKKLQYDKEKHSTKFSKKVEEKLNEVGLFDSEIEQFDKETIDIIQNSSYTQVSVVYYKEDNNTGEKIQMSQEEIDLLINEKIQDGEMEYKKKGGGIIEKMLKGIGIIPVDVKAASESDTDQSPSGALKSYLIVSQSKKGQKIYVTYTSTWLKEAYYREKDVMGLEFVNVASDKSSFKCDHWATYTCKSMDGNGKYSYREETKHTKPTAKKVKGAGFTYTVNLFGDRASMNANKGAGVIENYKNEFITIQFTCDPVDTNSKYTIFSSVYNHWESDISVNPSISIGTGGISVDVSAGVTNYYNEFDKNVSVKFEFLK